MRRVLAIALLAAGCSRQAPEPIVAPPPGFFRLTAEPTLLVPPAPGAPATIEALDLESCPDELDGTEIQRTTSEVRIVMDEDRLLDGPRGWLSAWALELERLGCLAVGDGSRLAQRIAHSAALPLGRERRLLEVSEGRDGYLDLGAGHRLRTTRPVFREGSTPTQAFTRVGETKAGPPGTLTVSVRATEDLVGFERAWYELIPVGRTGARIRSLSALVVEDGEESPRPHPLGNWLEFPESSRYFRLLFLSRRTETAENDILLLGAATPVELADLTRDLRDNPDLCGIRPDCLRAPVETAVLPFISVEVDGEPTLLAPGSTIRDALETVDGAPVPLGPLRVWKPSGGREVPVRYHDPKSILDLPLLGGERIWTK